MGLNHLDVVATLKQLPNFVNLVCARCSVPTRIINTAQHRDAFEERVSMAYFNRVFHTYHSILESYMKQKLRQRLRSK